MRTLKCLFSKRNTDESPVNKGTVFAKTPPDKKAEAMNLVKQFQHGKRSVPVASVDPDVLNLLVEKGIIVLSGSTPVGKVATICPGIFMCPRCTEFVAARSKFEHASCKAMKTQLELPGINTTRARGCSRFSLSILEEMN